MNERQYTRGELMRNIATLQNEIIKLAARIEAQGQRILRLQDALDRYADTGKRLRAGAVVIPFVAGICKPWFTSGERLKAGAVVIPFKQAGE